MENLYQKFDPSTEVKHLHVSAEESQVPKLNHFSWARHPAYFASEIKNWIASV